VKLGEHYHVTLFSMRNLASALWNQGQWKEAEILEMQVMETRKMKVGVGHPSPRFPLWPISLSPGNFQVDTGLLWI
jgi:hypothetical protein